MFFYIFYITYIILKRKIYPPQPIPLKLYSQRYPFNIYFPLTLVFHSLVHVMCQTWLLFGRVRRDLKDLLFVWVNRILFYFEKSTRREETNSWAFKSAPLSHKLFRSIPTCGPPFHSWTNTERFSSYILIISP